MDLTTSAESRTIVKSIVRLAHEMKMRVVAEGVEDKPSLDLLARMGCDLAQGYYFARPLTPEVLVANGWVRPAGAGIVSAAAGG
jgi:EAL domain-containing protein (putative c-di-GMP-specific phosphodiesterase class I)